MDVYQFQIPWDQVAATQPADPRNPADPAYNWSSIYDFIVSEAAANGIALAARVHGSPPWANGGRSAIWVPSKPNDLADFMYAASLRFPTIKRWMVWGEPARRLLPAPGSEEIPQAVREAARGRIPGAEAGEREQHRDRRHDPQRGQRGSRRSSFAT